MRDTSLHLSGTAALLVYTGKIEIGDTGVSGFTCVHGDGMVTCAGTGAHVVSWLENIGNIGKGYEEGTLSSDWAGDACLAPSYFPGMGGRGCHVEWTSVCLHLHLPR